MNTRRKLTTVRIDLDLVEQLDRDAAEHDRPRNWVVNQVLRAHYSRRLPRVHVPEREREAA